jgi:hypothetical protein
MKAKLAQRPVSPIRVQRQPASATQARNAPVQQPVLRVIDGGLDSVNLLRLQSAAGNQAVGDLLARPRLSVQAAVDCPPAPAAAPPVAPHEDPRFVEVKERVEGESVKQKQHPPAKAKVAESEGAAKGPTNEVASKAAANQVEDMGEQKPKAFDRAAFITAVHAAIERASPKTLKEVDDFKDSGKAGELKGQVVGNVTQSKDAAAKDVKGATEKAPNQSGIAAKPVKPMEPERPGMPPADPHAGDAMPPPKPAEQVSLDNTKCETDGQLAEANITDEQVAKSNEPQFHEAMAAKKEADEHAATAPQQFREDEQKQLGEAQTGAGTATSTGLSEMHQSRASAAGHVGSHKDAAKTKNEAARARVATEIEGIYNATKKDVDDIFKGLDTTVASTFDAGEKAAREAFENDYSTKKDAYFDDRYSGLRGKYRWAKDKLFSPPARVNEFIEEAKKIYVTKMEKVVNDVATIVETELGRATKRIADGRQSIKDYVAKQPKELKKVASEAADQISSKFDELDQSVTDKANDVVDDLAEKYVAASKEVDERCDAMREENKGLLEKARDKIAGLIDALSKIKDMLFQIAAKAASVVGEILGDPIGFLGNLVGAVKSGFEQFVGNIGKHLEEGLMGWLLGELADAGITMPESFDLKGILHLVAQVLGLTWTNFRARASAMLGEEVVGMIEQGVGVFQKIAHIFTTIRDQGVAGLWDMISDKIGDLKEMVMDKIQDFVIVKVITAGVTWIIGLLNPASAFIKACKAIYDIVMFFIERGSQIMALVNAILDNLAAIASGNISAAADLVETVLAKGLPLVIGFLASLLGVGGISEKIKEVITAVRKPITKAVDWVLKSVVKPVAKLAARAIGFAKGKVKAAGAWLKKKGQAGVEYLKKKGTAAIEKVRGKFGRKPKPGAPDDVRTLDDKRRDLDGAVGAAETLVADESLTDDAVRDRLPELRATYRLTKLSLVVDQAGDEGETVHIEGAVNPSKKGSPRKRKLSKKQRLKRLQAWLASAVATFPILSRISLTKDLAEKLLKTDTPDAAYERLRKARRYARTPGQGASTGEVRPYGDRPQPGEPGYRPGLQWHHPEAQSALREAIVGYNPEDDPTIGLAQPEHGQTFEFQPKRTSPKWDPKLATLGSPLALSEAAALTETATLGRPGAPALIEPGTAERLALEHSAYMFGLTPASEAQSQIAEHEAFEKDLRVAADAVTAVVAQLQK